MKIDDDPKIERAFQVIIDNAIENLSKQLGIKQDLQEFHEDIITKPEPKTFHFKSIKKFYEKELVGVKNNTVRTINLEEQKFLDLIDQVNNNPFCDNIKIKISEVGNSNKYFIRDIKDISIWGKLMIITWKHKSDKSQQNI